MSELKDLCFRKSVEINTSDADDRSTVPLRLSMGRTQILEVRRVVFDFFSGQNPPTVGLHRIHCGLSSADIEPESDAADTSTAQQFFDRNDIVVAQSHVMQMPTTPSTSPVGQHHYVHDFRPGELMLPRSPSFVLFAQNAGSDDSWFVHAHLYFVKRSILLTNLLKLIKLYKSIKAATVPRVIDT